MTHIANHDPVSSTNKGIAPGTAPAVPAHALGGPYSR